MPKVNFVFVLGIIVVLGAVFRLPFLNYSPPELFGDEIDVGYHAYSLLKTGKDMYGQILPTYIHSLSEWRAPLLMYATVPTIAIFGTNEWGVRLPEAIFGLLMPLILAYLVYQSSRNKSHALWTAFFAATLPWHIHYSRAAFEVVLMLDLALLGTAYLLKKKSFLSAIFFSLSLYTYSTALVFIPLFISLIMVFKRKLFSWRFFVLSILFCLPLLSNVLGGTASKRFNSLSVINNKDAVDKIFTLRQASSPLWGKMLYNRPAVITGIVIDNYLRAFSTDFLFVRGDPDYRHNLQIIGEILPLSAIFLLVGLIGLIVKKEILWVVWLALAPIPAALTYDGANHATRLFWMIPPLAVALGLGFVSSINLLPKKFKALGTGFALILIAGQLVGVAYYYLNIYRIQSWRWWNVGYKNAMLQLRDEAADYNQVFINNSYEPALIRFLFWTKYPPSEFHRLFVSDKPIKNIVPGYDGFALGDKYYFGGFNSPDRTMRPQSLYLLSHRDDGPPPTTTKNLYTSTNGLFDPILYLVASP